MFRMCSPSVYLVFFSFVDFTCGSGTRFGMCDVYMGKLMYSPVYSVDTIFVKKQNKNRRLN